MKVALIPPLGWESYLAQSDGVLMALALENCIDNIAYTGSFKLMKHTGSKRLLILDNGAAEGERAKNGTVNKFAAHLEAQEIVLPDVLGSRSETISKVHEYFRYTKWDTGIQYMGVVQGDSIRHAQQCVRDYAETQAVLRETGLHEKLQPITTLGIPRRLIKVTEEFSARIDLANWILGEYGMRFEIHFLGAAPEWPHEVKYAAKYASQVRSIDTSMPFNYAIANSSLQNVRPGPSLSNLIGRVPGYMVGNLVNRNPALVQVNIDTYLTWAKG